MSSFTDVFQGFPEYVFSALTIFKLMIICDFLPCITFYILSVEIWIRFII